MTSVNGNSEEVDTFEYSETDFISQAATWTDPLPPQVSKFDKAVHERWDRAMANGVFRYNIDHIITRIIPGPKQYVAQLNTLRATERRKPQVITSVNQPFNPKSFNFTWVKKEEIIFNMRKRKHSLGEVSTNGACNDKAGDGTVTNGADSEKVSSSEEERHCLIVNVSPMEYGHCLLLPEVDMMQPQVLTEKALEVAIETMLLSQHRGFRLGFNSLCAFASVNHLHFHAYYLNHELIVDHCPVGHLGGMYYEFTALPCPGFVLQLHGSTIKQIAKDTYKISSYFHNSDIAHNVYICRGTVFGEDRNSKLTTVRLFIWPRKKYIGTKSSDEFNVACIELGGHLPIKGNFDSLNVACVELAGHENFKGNFDSVNMACAELAGHENVKEEEGYHRFTEEDVDAIVDAANLSAEDYRRIKQKVTRMGLESEAGSPSAERSQDL